MPEFKAELMFDKEKKVITPRRLISYIEAQPFRPFRTSMASGQSLEIKHPEMISVGRSTAHINFFFSDDPEHANERVQEISLMLMESIEPIEAVTSEKIK